MLLSQRESPAEGSVTWLSSYFPSFLVTFFVWCLGEALTTVGRLRAKHPWALPDHLYAWLSLVAHKGSEGLWKVPLTLGTYPPVPHGTRHDVAPWVATVLSSKTKFVRA